MFEDDDDDATEVRESNLYLRLFLHFMATLLLDIGFLSRHVVLTK